MSIKRIAFATLMAFACVPVAAAAPVLDGLYDSSYGAAKSTVTYLPGSPNSNFDAPTQFSDATNYSIYLATDANYVYGLLRSDRNTGSAFANLYFGALDSDGSYLGFEITNDRAFIPGTAGYSAPLSALTYAVSADNMGVEFRLANSLFTSYIPGLTYSADQPSRLPAIGDNITLRLSQSFSNSVAGGATYGPNRLGTVTLGANTVSGAVPEPASWAMMLVGFGAIGAAMRRRKVAVRFA